jgi:hypothetical protein
MRWIAAEQALRCAAGSFDEPPATSHLITFGSRASSSAPPQQRLTVSPNLRHAQEDKDGDVSPPGLGVHSTDGLRE